MTSSNLWSDDTANATNNAAVPALMPRASAEILGRLS
jgi:hypothetical protein